jgi:hypothetical protein
VVGFLLLLLLAVLRAKLRWPSEKVENAAFIGVLFLSLLVLVGVIIDLKESQAWRETRLLVLLVGVERLKKPEKIVFVVTDAGKGQCF